MPTLYRLPLVLAPQPEGGYTITSPGLPGFLTEGDSAEEALAHVEDALSATVELYQDLGRKLPDDLVQDPRTGVIQFDHLLLTA